MTSPQRATDRLDAVVIGAGWAGLGVSYWLARHNLSHRVLERGRIAETWRTQRWDSFLMNTPNIQTVMPGDRYNGTEPEGVFTRNQFVSMLVDFAERNKLPVDTASNVTELVAVDGGYRVSTGGGALYSKAVVIASGCLNCAIRPLPADAFLTDIVQLDASNYRSAADLPDGAVLVVGSGQSGAQIAEELVQTGRSVFLATSRVGRLPRRYRGRDIMLWLDESGMLDVRREEVIRLAGRIPARGVLGSQHTISLQALGAQGIVLLGRLTDVEPDGRLSFADDLGANIRFADEASENAKRFIDDYIARAGISAQPSEPDPAEMVGWRPAYEPPVSLDLAARNIATIIWCTGFKGDYRYMRIPGALDVGGQPVHTDGIGVVPGLYYAGLDFASTRRSGIILALAEEAPRLVEHIVGQS